jgi:lysophospholipase L1-like esterase
VQRNDSFNARAKQGAQKGDIGVVFLGDSITEAWGGPGKEVWKQRYEGRKAVNFGIGGDRTQHVIWRVENGNLEGLAKPKEGRPPRLVVLMIGTNNTGSDSAEEIAAGIGAVVKAVRKKLPGTPVLLLGVFPRGEKVDDPLRSKIADINSRISLLDDGEKVVYLDIGEKFVGEGGAISKEIMPDSLHLSPKGYEIWGEAIQATMARMLSEEKPTK